MKIIHEIINRGKGFYGDSQNQLTRDELLRIYDETRSISSIILTTSGTSGPATYNSVTGTLNIPNYTQQAVTGFVPYTGATQNVNLGDKILATDAVQFSLLPVSPNEIGRLRWNPDRYTLDLGMGLGGSIQQIGMETYYTPVKNQTGSVIPDGTFVMATGSLGASGRITIAPAVTDGSIDSRYMLGVTTHDIDPNVNDGDGLVTWFGEIRGFNTNTKAPVGETWIDGTVLWNNPAVPGGFTSIEPQAPNLKIPVAIVVSAGNNGVIFVRPRLGMRLTDLHDVDAFTPSDKNLISYDAALGHWNAKSLGSVIGGASSQFVKGDGSLDSNAYALASQINIASGQVAFGTGVGAIGGDSGLTWDNVNKRLGINVTPTSILDVSGTSTSGFNAIKFKSQYSAVGFLGTDNTNAWLSSETNGGGSSLRVSSTTLRFFRQGVESARFDANGLGILTNAPTNTLDVNGDARIRTINNLGYTATEFLTQDPLGVISKRTASETLADIGAIGGTIASGEVAFGTASNTIGGDSGFVWDNVNKILSLESNTLNFPRIVLRTNASISGGTFGNGIVFFRNLSANNIGIFNDPSNGHTTNVDALSIALNSSPFTRLVTFNQNGSVKLGSYANNTTVKPPSNTVILGGQFAIGLTNPSIPFDVIGISRFRTSLLVGSSNSATDTLDVDGTARIRTINNLGYTATEFLTQDPLGVIHKRTASETLVDIGGIGGTIASGQVAFGTASNTIGGDSGLTWNNTNKNLSIVGGAFSNVLSLLSNVNTRLLISGAGNGYTQGEIVIQSGTTGTPQNRGLGVYLQNQGNNTTWYFGNPLSSVGYSSDSFVINRKSGSGVLITTSSAGESTNLFVIRNNGNVGLSTTTDAGYKLDVNGTVRIQSIANATGDFVTASATGVLQKRTVAEVLTDIGGIGGTIASGQVAVGTGTGTILGSNNFKFENAQIFGLVGSLNLGLKLTTTNATGNKLVKIGIPHYDTTEEDIIGIYMVSLASSNTLVYGGGSGAQNSMTEHRWRVGANNITPDGTTRMSLSNSGLSLFNGDTVASNTLDVNGTARIRTSAYIASDSGNVILGGLVDTGLAKLQVNGDATITNALLSNQSNTDVDSAAPEIVAQVSSSVYTAVFFDYSIKNGTNLRAGTVYATHDGINVVFTETMTQDLGDTSGVDLNVDLSGGQIRLVATVATDNWSIKTLIRGL